MIVGPLVYKALRYDPQKKLFVSPSANDEWNRYGILDAKCTYMNRCDSIPGEDCTCGIYATTDINLALYGYAGGDDAVVFLMEGTGKVILYTQGLRAEQGVIIGAIDLHHVGETEHFSPRHMSLMFAADYFSVPIYSPEMAAEMLSIQWEKYMEVKRA